MVLSEVECLSQELTASNIGGIQAELEELSTLHAPGKKVALGSFRVLSIFVRGQASRASRAEGTDERVRKAGRPPLKIP